MERYHFPLVLLAMCSAALLAGRRAGAQSGDLVPGSGSGGEGATVYTELVRHRNVSGELQAGDGGGGSGAAPAGLSPSDGFCSLYSHNVQLEFRGCVGEYPAFSCTGRCHTEQRPNVFTRRQDARVDPHITTCRCCSQVRYGLRSLRLNLTCPDSTYITVRHITAVALDCGCTSCY